jgi:diguanylate cyclase (GGDEF)-like protein
VTATVVAPPAALQSPTRPRRPSVSVYIALVVLAGAGMTALALAVAEQRPSERSLSGLLLGLMFFGTTSYVANFAYGRQVHAFQLCDVPRLLGLLFASPATLIAARLLGALPAMVVIRRQLDRKLLFNLGSFALEVSTAVLVFSALAPESAGIGPQVWPAAFAATAAADLVSSASVGLAIALSEGLPVRRTLLGPARVSLGTSFGACILGLIVATTYFHSASAAGLLAVLVGIAMVGSRSYAQVVERNEEAVRLQTLLSELGPVTLDAGQLPRLLELVRELFGVERVHLVRRHADGGQVRTVCMDEPGLRSDPLPDRDTAVLERALAQGEPTSSSPLGRLRFPPRRARAMAAPLRGRHGPLGGLLVVEPLGDVRAFSALDLRLLAGVSAQLGAALERGEELARLEWAANHDPVTGLINAQAWRREASQRLTAHADHLVLIVDIARLRGINDVFGRETGDVALIALADRLRSHTADGVAGRVGGHHYALLVPRPKRGSRAAYARQLRAALQQPLELDGLSIEVGVHIGVSAAPRDGADPEVLLRRAESALDGAKDDPFGVAVFVREMERDAARPLRLVSDLKAALNGATTGGTLRLVYQPKVELRTGRMYGAEALARWDHPELGAVPPDEFVAVAEETGLINPLTDWVLHRALTDCAAWRAAGHSTTVAVNLSARSLLDSDLVHRVDSALRAAGLPPEALVLELTETSVMAHPARSVVVLDALYELGVGLSIDDFGTGYSSLAYLRQLPVDEVKLDRSFLAPVHDPTANRDGKAEALVRETIRLTHSLELHVLVEGVEDQRMLDTLVVLGADAVQGWFTGRPVPTDQLHDGR